MPPIVHELLQYLWSAAVATFTQLLILLAPGVLLATLMYVVSRITWNNAIALIGWTRYAYIFGIIGIPIHEIGHMVFNFLFGHNVTEVRLFTPNDPTASGHVYYSMDSNNPYHRIGVFFTAIGPILFGSIVIYAATYLLVGDIVLAPVRGLTVTSAQFGSLESAGGFALQSIRAMSEMLDSLFSPSNLTTWRFYLFLFLAFSIGSFMTLSGTDLKNASSGFAYVVGLLLTLNVLTLWITRVSQPVLHRVGSMASPFYAVMIFVLFLNLGAAWLTTLILQTKTAFLHDRRRIPVVAGLVLVPVLLLSTPTVRNVSGQAHELIDSFSDRLTSVASSVPANLAPKSIADAGATKGSGPGGASAVEPGVDTSVASAERSPSVIPRRPASAQESRSVASIWALAHYVDLLSPGTRDYAVTLQDNTPKRWGMNWCAPDTGQLQRLLEAITMRMYIDETLLPPKAILEYDAEGGSHWMCHHWVTVLSEWQPFSTVKLDLDYTLSEDISDSRQSWPAGRYHQIILVSTLEAAAAP